MTKPFTNRETWLIHNYESFLSKPCENQGGKNYAPKITKNNNNNK